MRGEFIKEEKILDKTDEEKRIELIKTVIKTRNDLENYNKNFEFVDADLIDYYTLQIKAYKTKLDYLIKTAKKNGIKFDRIEDISINKNDVI